MNVKSESPPLAELFDLGGELRASPARRKGFGFACARRPGEAGAAVVLADRRADPVEVAAQLRDAGSRPSDRRGRLSIRGR